MTCLNPVSSKQWETPCFPLSACYTQLNCFPELRLWLVRKSISSVSLRKPRLARLGCNLILCCLVLSVQMATLPSRRQSGAKHRAPVVPTSFEPPLCIPWQKATQSPREIAILSAHISCRSPLLLQQFEGWLRNSLLTCFSTKTGQTACLRLSSRQRFIEDNAWRLMNVIRHTTHPSISAGELLEPLENTTKWVSSDTQYHQPPWGSWLYKNRDAKGCGGLQLDVMSLGP